MNRTWREAIDGSKNIYIAPIKFDQRWIKIGKNIGKKKVTRLFRVS